MVGTTAITVWNGIISPLYDAAERIMLLLPDGTREYSDVGRMSVYHKAELLANSGTRVLICGAISEIARAILIARGIRVHPWIRGTVEDVLRAYSDGVLDSEPFRMPGCHGKGRCQRLGHRRKGGVH